MLIALLLTSLLQAPAAGAPAGATVVTIDSREIGERRAMWVQAAADCSPAKPCDTLYVLDAHALYPLATAYAAVMQSMGRMRPLVIVGVPSLSMEDRLRNFTSGATAAERTRYPSAGGSKRFAAFLQREAVPAIAARFGDNGTRVLAGHSLAGLFAIDELVSGDWNAVAAISPTLGWQDASAIGRVEAWMKTTATPRRLYASVADGDTEVYRRQFDRLEQLLSANPARLSSLIARRAGEDHVSTIAPALQQAMLWLFANPAPARD